MTAKVPFSEFLDRAKSQHGDRYSYVESEYSRMKAPVGVKCDKHGVFYLIATSHTLGVGCRECYIESKPDLARSTKQEFVQKAIELHGQKYDYTSVVYKSAKELVQLRCGTHGRFDITPNKHLSGGGCQKCAKEGMFDIIREKARKSFLEQAYEVHGLKYSYELIKYKNNLTKVEIICKEHKSFWQTPTGHLCGNGCPNCATNGFQPNKSGILYILRSGNITKIGITNNRLSKRVKAINKSSGRKFEVLTQITFASGAIADKLETDLLRLYRSTHVSVNETFDGYTECFYDVNYAELLANTVKFCSNLLPKH